MHFETYGTGKIWAIWDKKFWAKEIQSQYREEIDKSESRIKASEEMLYRRELEYSQLLQRKHELEIDEYASQTAFENYMVDKTWEFEVVQNRTKELQRETEILNERIEKLTEEATKHWEEKEILEIEVAQMKIDIKMLEQK